MSMTTVNFDILNLESGDRVLDLGCGEGRHAITAYMLAEVESVGVDLSLKDLQTTFERFSGFQDPQDTQRSLSVSVASGHCLPFPDNSFDKLICSEVLEHILDYRSVLTEITRVLKTGGIFVTSVPRFFPEWVCWQLSAAYHAMEGGHVRIFNADQLRTDIEENGFRQFDKHHAHALHVPYWWLKCLFWKPAGAAEASIVRLYHQFLVWDLMQQPRLTKLLERILSPIMGKSVVMYFVKTCSNAQTSTESQPATHTDKNS